MPLAASADPVELESTTLTSVGPRGASTAFAAAFLIAFTATEHYYKRKAKQEAQSERTAS
jgi:hypothetical protein